jgi:hypothetical protein
MGGERFWRRFLLNLWIELVAAGLIAFAGLLAGAAVSRLGKRPALGTCLGVVFIILALGAGWLIPISMYNSVIFAIFAGRFKFLLLAFFVPMGLSCAMPYLPYKIERYGVVVMTAMSIYVFGVFPFLGAAMAGQRLASVPASFDSNGVCLQSTSFTCGPAAAATALHRLGVDVSEGQMAVLSHSCPFIGTSDYDLMQAVSKVTSRERVMCNPAQPGVPMSIGMPQKIECTYGRWDKLPSVSGRQVLLVILQQGMWMNHCVAVLKTTDKAVVFADPAEGIITLSQKHFQQLWTGRGILLQDSAAK